MELLALADENKKVLEFALQMAMRVHSDRFNITDNACCDVISDTAALNCMTLTLDFLILLVSHGNKLWKRHSKDTPYCLPRLHRCLPVWLWRQSPFMFYLSACGST